MEVRLHAIGIDDVRDMFGAQPALAARLRTIASERFRVPQEEQRPRSRLARLGPLFRRDPWEPLLDPSLPSPDEVELLVNGQFVPPQRLPQAWLVMQAWLEELSFGHTRVTLSDSDWNAAEFELACAGLPSQFGLARLWALDPALPLRPAPGMRIGYSKHHHAVATRDALANVPGTVSDSTASAVTRILGLLDGLDAWTAAATTSGRPVPDVVALVRELT